MNGVVAAPDRMVKVRIAADGKLRPSLATTFTARKGTDMAEISDPENTIIMETTKGKVVIQLLPDVAPQHVARIKELAREKFYDGVVFHRVIEGFMAQGGDPTGTGMGGSEKPNLPAEFNNVPHVRGTCSMARSPARIRRTRSSSSASTMRAS